MNVLILGGTGFVGPHTVDAAIAAGMTVTLFNRGKSNPTRFGNIERLQGDRDPLNGDGLSKLAGRKWDAVIDICGYVPRLVAASAQLLTPNVGHYVFISTISVYSDLSHDSIDEHSAVGTLEDPTVEKVTGETYGPLKVLCERAAEAAMPGRVTCIRPGLIVGPGDTTDRFTYWPVRLDHGGQVLAPGDPSDRVQMIDGRDLANFIIDVVKRKTVGVMNAVGPAEPLEMGDMLRRCQAAIGSNGSLIWAGTEFLKRQDVRPWADIPLWIESTSDMRGFARMDNRLAINAGLKFRSIEETAVDTLAWYKDQKSGSPLRAGLTADRERELLDALV